MILSGSRSQSLAAALAAETGHELAGASRDRFPDGEQLVELDPPELDEAVVVASTVSDAAHVELLQLQDAAREAGASRVTTVLPYMGYARQDEAFEPGQPVSARAVARALSTGTDRVFVVEPHEPGVCEHFEVPAELVAPAGLLAEPLGDLTEPLFLAPDAGAADLAETVRDAYGRGAVDHCEKTRHSGSEVTVEPAGTGVGGRDVVLVDDIVATGSTMSQAIAGMAGDAASVTVACVHALFARDAYTKLRRAGVDAVYATDTVERPVSEVSVAPAVADRL
ncbi:ribose-phosphate diphosphokinase [Salinirussus salinus]|uniref:ribose-phosphate diphosphokinase n=1 Tax=Salinirussus salinus TaxID=1198300 RepID=UPI0013588E0A|nr:ribose-phosphate diphosphokinase [Salinirussus salinus]